MLVKPEQMIVSDQVFIASTSCPYFGNALLCVRAFFGLFNLFKFTFLLLHLCIQIDDVTFPFSLM